MIRGLVPASCHAASHVKHDCLDETMMSLVKSVEENNSKTFNLARTSAQPRLSPLHSTHFPAGMADQMLLLKRVCVCARAYKGVQLQNGGHRRYRAQFTWLWPPPYSLLSTRLINSTQLQRDGENAVSGCNSYSFVTNPAALLELGMFNSLLLVKV